MAKLLKIKYNKLKSKKNPKRRLDLLNTQHAHESPTTVSMC